MEIQLTIDLRPNGPLYDNFTLDALRKEGVSEEVIQSELQQLRKQEASVECRRRIYAVASAETQMNMAAASAVISAKTASTRTDQEKAVLAGLEAAIGWVAAMRNNIATLAADPIKDVTADASWPDCPASAAAIAAQF